MHICATLASSSQCLDEFTLHTLKMKHEKVKVGLRVKIRGAVIKKDGYEKKKQGLGVKRVMSKHTVMVMKYIHKNVATKITYKFLYKWKLSEELYTTKVISRGNSSTRVVQMSRVDICFVSISWPHTHHLLTKYTTSHNTQQSHNIPWNMLFQRYNFFKVTALHTSSKRPMWSCWWHQMM